MTHYRPFFSRVRGALVQMACGAWVTNDQHSVLPDCPQCAAYLNEVPNQPKAPVLPFAKAIGAPPAGTPDLDVPEGSR